MQAAARRMPLLCQSAWPCDGRSRASVTRFERGASLRAVRRAHMADKPSALPTTPWYATNHAQIHRRIDAHDGPRSCAFVIASGWVSVRHGRTTT